MFTYIDMYMHFYKYNYKERNGEHVDDVDEKKDEIERRKKLVKSTSSGSKIDIDALKKSDDHANKGGEGGLISSAFTHMRTVSAFFMQYEVSQQYGEMTQIGIRLFIYSFTCTYIRIQMH
jgi:hypothetical protein